MGFGHLMSNIRDAKRFEQILAVFLKHGFDYYLTKTELKDRIPVYRRVTILEKEAENTKPKRLKAAFEELGGTFVKLGQLLSLRPDIVPPEYTDELAQLTDSVKPFPYAEVKKIVEGALERPIEDIFRSFDKRPLAAASIAQVHRAVLKTGEEVVVKVRRPNIDKIMTTDIDILYHIAKALEKKFDTPLIKPTEIVHEFERYTLEELDFKIEGRNIDRIRDNFHDDDSIKVPKVHWEFVTSRTLVMEYIDGIKVSDLVKKCKAIRKKRKSSTKMPKKVAGYDIHKVVCNITESFMRQVFVDGYFHADPHQGNLMVLEDNSVAYLDLGITGRLTGSLKSKLRMMFISIMNKDVEELSDTMLNMGMVDEGTFNKEIFKEDLAAEMEKYYAVDLGDIDFGAAFNAILFIARKNRIRLPTNIVLLGKSIITVEGLCANIDPSYNLVHESRPFLKRLVKEELSVDGLKNKFYDRAKLMRRLVTTVPEQTMRFLSKLNKGDFKIEFEHKDLEELIGEMEKASNKVTLGAITAALLIASGLSVQLEMGTVFGLPWISFIGFSLSLVFVLVLLRLMFK